MEKSLFNTEGSGSGQQSYTLTILGEPRLISLTKVTLHLSKLYEKKQQ